jgi:TatA/E family protein of Tat protein translocase
MCGLRFHELLIIAAVLLLLFGATRLPALGAGLGGALRGFKRSLSGDDEKTDGGKAPGDDAGGRHG